MMSPIANIITSLILACLGALVAVVVIGAMAA